AAECLALFRVGDTDELRPRLAADERAVYAIEQMESIVDLCEGTPAHGHLSFTPSLARGLSYYTGTIMEVAVPDLAGSLGGGGRYDKLVGMFLGRDVPACGFSLGLECILAVMAERKMFPSQVDSGSVEVKVTFWNEESDHKST